MDPYPGRMTPEARVLRYFLAVAEERNFTRAAARLHIAQPALSAQISQLEKRLGVRLLHRTTREVRLTDAGREVLARGPAALAALDEVWDAARRAGRGELGRLRLLYSASTGYGTVPYLVQEVRVRLPGLEVSAEVAATPGIARAVLDGRADAGVARMPRPEAGVRLVPLRHERRGLMVAADHPLAARGDAGAGVADIVRYPVLVHPREANPAHHDATLALLRTAVGEPRLVERPVSFDPTQQALRDGEVVALVGESSAHGLPDWLRWVPLTGPHEPMTIALVLPEGEPAPAVARFTETALEIAAEAGWLPEPDEGR
jgi:LysR family transcriptional regulator, benzoate and cis,cis-muconate-responsive activator of ben and cat genes